MDKTSVYLSAADRRRLARLARAEHVSQAEIIRRAIATYYQPTLPADRRFSLSASFDGPGTSVADVPEDELLRGMGD